MEDSLFDLVVAKMWYILIVIGGMYSVLKDIEE